MILQNSQMNLKIFALKYFKMTFPKWQWLLKSSAFLICSFRDLCRAFWITNSDVDVAIPKRQGKYWRQKAYYSFTCWVLSWFGNHGSPQLCLSQFYLILVLLLYFSTPVWSFLFINFLRKLFATSFVLSSILFLLCVLNLLIVSSF